MFGLLLSLGDASPDISRHLLVFRKLDINLVEDWENFVCGKSDVSELPYCLWLHVFRALPNFMLTRNTGILPSGLSALKSATSATSRSGHETDFGS